MKVWMLLLLLLATRPVAAQVGLHIDLSAPQVEIDSTHVALSVAVAAQGMEVRSAEQYVVELVLQGEKQWALPEVVYAGRLRYFYRERERLFADGETRAPYHVYRKVKRDKAYVLDYRLSLPYEPWMEQADLVYAIYRESGRGRTQIAEGTLIEELRPVEEEKPAVWNLDPEEYRNMLLFKAPVPESKHRTLEFTLNENGEMSEVVQRQLDTLFTYEYITVDSIRLYGYSSPDGPETTNERLARQRTESLKARLVERYGTKIQHAVANGIGEDWAGLERLVRDTTGNEDALSIILDSELSPEVKERILKKIGHGTVWKQMREQMFPRLRRIEAVVDYTVAPWPDDLLGEQLLSHPAWLSAEEMFRAAQRFEPGNERFFRACETAVAHYPGLTEGWINAAAARLWAGDTEGAGKLLRKTPESPEAQVNLGVYYYIAGDLLKAEQCFTRAAEAGVEKGTENLRFLHQKTQ